MTTHACEVRFRSFPGGNPENMQITLPDTVNADDPAAVRAYVDAEVSRRIRAGHLAPGEVSYDIFVDKNGTAGFQADERLGFGADRSTLAWGTTARHPLTANIQAMRDDILSAEVTGLDDQDLDPQTADNQIIPTSSLHDLQYTSDGADGVGPSEAQSLLARFQSLFSNDESGRRQLFEAYRRNPQVRFGPNPRDTVSLQEVYRTAGVPPPDGNSRPTIPGQPGAAEDPNAPDPLRRAFATGDVDTGEIQRRLRKLEQQLRDLEARLRMGIVDPVDAHSQMMNIFAGMMNLIGGEAELRLSAQLQGKLNEFRDSTTRTADALSASRSGSQAGNVERGRADQQMVLNDIQALQRIMTQILDSMSEQSRHATEATQKRGEILARV